MKSEVIADGVVAVGCRFETLELLARDDLARGIAQVEPVETDVPVPPLPVPIIVAEGQSNRFRPGPDNGPSTDSVSLSDREPDSISSKASSSMPGVTVAIDSREEPPLRVRKQEQLAHHDRTAHRRRVSFGDSRHHRREVPCPFRDAVRIDAAVQEPVVVGQRARLPPFRMADGDPAFPRHSGEGGRLLRELLRGEEAPCPCGAKRDVANRVRLLERVRAEPPRERHLDEQVLEVVRAPGPEPLPEPPGEPRYLLALVVRGEQETLESRVRLVLGGLRDLAPHQRRPPELDGCLGETIVGDDLLRKPLHTAVRVRGQLVGYTRRSHVLIPDRALPGTALAPTASRGRPPSG